MSSKSSAISITEFYNKKTVFITGGTGFLGKAIIEKLLRSCPDISNIYMLIRNKRQLSGEDRLRKFLEDPVFSKLKEKLDDDWKVKVKPIIGDITKLSLGISKEDKDLLKENIEIFLHVAATVKFDDPLKNAIITNTRGTREACNLALEMKKIKIFVYVSTAYSNLYRKTIDEILYPPPAKWQEAIKMAEEMNPYEIQIISNKILNNFPNTYTFTKALAEQVVNDTCNGKIPAVILRPSIVIAAIDEPIPGWIDNFNGPMGVCIGTGKGVLHTYLGNRFVKMNMIPVDFTIKSILLAVYYKLNIENNVKEKQLQVYNVCAKDEDLLSLEEIHDICLDLVNDYPLSNPLWYPTIQITRNKLVYFISMLMLHLFPAILIDLIIRILEKKPFLFKLQKKIYIANTVLMPFSTYEWIFINKNFLKMAEWIKTIKYSNFTLEYNSNHKENIKNTIISSKKFLLKEGVDFEKDKKHLFRMKILHNFVKFGFRIIIIYIIFVKFSAIQVIYNVCINYYNSIIVR